MGIPYLVEERANSDTIEERANGDTVEERADSFIKCISLIY